ncbi:sodium glucose cotransporter 1-like [Pitangus sulphuratus]|nr:sodium glucose cotransporter 1-like [Pitangus sulphuratus]
MGVLVYENLDRPSNVHVQPRKPNMHQKQRGEEIEGSDSAHLLFSHETPPGVLNPGLGSSAQDGHRDVGASPEEGDRDD